jgi:hypothetical protein
METRNTVDGHPIFFEQTDRGWEISDRSRVQHRGYTSTEVANLVKGELSIFARDEIPALVKAASAELRCKEVDHNRLRRRVAVVS